MLIKDKQVMETKEYVIVLKSKEKKKKKVTEVNLDFKNKTIKLLKYRVNLNIPFTIYIQNNMNSKKNLKSINYLFFNNLYFYLLVNKQFIIKKFYLIIKIIFYLKLINVK
jgi:hypothetical protein